MTSNKLLLLGIVMLGCGGHSDTPDANPAVDGGGPIVAPSGTWTWIPIEGMRALACHVIVH